MDVAVFGARCTLRYEMDLQFFNVTGNSKMLSLCFIHIYLLFYIVKARWHPSVDIGKSCVNGCAEMMENNREHRIALVAAGLAARITSDIFNNDLSGPYAFLEFNSLINEVQYRAYVSYV
ncbi:hypothetical protein ZEAMMB73_Zm00001d044740 [Zea mays]|uniref:Uncharacterized protein n=1 Tax=Zea mays TaxID=4577 RepID=A0A1D6NR10_MAIZE|nr:hypothetical protein ZEAMMB73_Zm00001d044740 [Zea mays]